MTKVNYNVAIEEVSAAIKRYPLARFYEVQGYLTEDVNGDVKCNILETLEKTKSQILKKIGVKTLLPAPITANQAISILKGKFGIKLKIEHSETNKVPGCFNSLHLYSSRPVSHASLIYDPPRKRHKDKAKHGTN